MPATDLTPGTFSWVDLPTADAAGALAFYGPLFGWSHHRDPDLGGYIFLRRGSLEVAGMVELPPGTDQPPCWMSYILVDDIQSVLDRCVQLGGGVILPAREAGVSGTMALIRDPSGGVVGLWQARAFTGARLMREHGTLAWNELVSTDAERARTFYRELLGWEWRETPLPDGARYDVAHVGGRPAAGLMQMTDRWPAGMGSYWEVYFAVDDVDSAHAHALELGARAFVDPTDIAVGRFSVLRDPHGAAFTLFAPDMSTFEG